MHRSASLRPGPPLDRYVATIWANDRDALPHARERLLPTGAADLIVPLHDAPLVRIRAEDPRNVERFTIGLLSPVSERPVLRETGFASSVVGVHFRPGGLAAFVRPGIDTLGLHAIDAESVFGGELRRLRERLRNAGSVGERVRGMEAFLRSRLARASDPWIERAIAAIERDPVGARVAPLVATSGLSSTRFLERFRARVGLGPKRFARLVRLRRALDALATGDAGGTLARLSARYGFADHAHLTREFRALTGLAPSEYRPTAGAPMHVLEPEGGISFKRNPSRMR